MSVKLNVEIAALRKVYDWLDQDPVHRLPKLVVDSIFLQPTQKTLYDNIFPERLPFSICFFIMLSVTS